MNKTTHRILLTSLNKLIQFFELLQSLIPKLMRFIFDEFKFQVLDALAFIEIINLSRTINDVGKFIGD